ncbi:MAG TPA: glycosyltransferase family A protein [Chitinophagaceae bacterium]|jgi:glycosyltransferase involved in cell wall biosynthesis|nr:glycosyltransferase family A protein [Chitinophagaceae bacterium]
MSEMTGNILFTIVIPTYNRAHIIGATIESVLKQTYRNYEVIVVDDGSTDDTEKVIQQYGDSRLRYFKRDRQERSIARNFGTQQSKGQYINWFDSDDIMLPNHLEELAAIIKKYNSPALIGVAYEVERPDEGIVYQLKFPGPVLNPYMIRYNFLLTMTGIVRRDVALKYPFNSNAIPREDHELWLRIATEYQVIANNTVTVRIIEHDQSGSVITGNKANVYISELDAFIHEISINPSVQQLLNGNMSRFKMYRYAASAYYFASRGYKRPALRLLSKSLRSHPLILFRKEFYAVVKNIIFTHS